MVRGDIAVFGAGESYLPPVGGAYFEVVLKAEPTAGEVAEGHHRAGQNVIRHDGQVSSSSRSGWSRARPVLATATASAS